MLRILYVEDNPANLSLVHRVARVGGHEVVNRTSGEKTLVDFDSIRADIVLMDIQLEGTMSGLDLVRKLREQGHNSVPIIAVTAYAMKGDRQKAIEAGCDDYLPKPLPIQELVQLIDKYENLIQKRKTGEIEQVRSTQEAAPVEVVDEKEASEPTTPVTESDESDETTQPEPTAAKTDDVSSTKPSLPMPTLEHEDGSEEIAAEPQSGAIPDAGQQENSI